MLNYISVFYIKCLGAIALLNNVNKDYPENTY